MTPPSRPPANGFVRICRRVYNPIGFAKGYNFVLCKSLRSRVAEIGSSCPTVVIFAGATMGFTLARLQFLNFNGIFCGPSAGGGNSAAPGECYYYTRDHYKIGMMLHLFSILPAAFLVCFQFVPAIRHKAILFHRINGYTILILTVVGIAGKSYQSPGIGNK
jgi:hypothetical protein